jgi:hypothetical protein
LDGDTIAEPTLQTYFEYVKDIFEKTGTYLDPDVLDFFSEDLAIKKLIRPYIIWYGEKLRKVNGIFCWINRAFEEDGKDMDKNWWFINPVK